MQLPRQSRKQYPISRSIDVDGNKLILRDIMGDERVVEGSILMVDLANSIVKLQCD